MGRAQLRFFESFHFFTFVEKVKKWHLFSFFFGMLCESHHDAGLVRLASAQMTQVPLTVEPKHRIFSAKKLQVESSLQRVIDVTVWPFEGQFPSSHKKRTDLVIIFRVEIDSHRPSFGHFEASINLPFFVFSAFCCDHMAKSYFCVM